MSTAIKLEEQFEVEAKFLLTSDQHQQIVESLSQNCITCPNSLEINSTPLVANVYALYVHPTDILNDTSGEFVRKLVAQDHRKAANLSSKPRIYYDFKFACSDDNIDGPMIRHNAKMKAESLTPDPSVTYYNDKLDAILRTSPISLVTDDFSQTFECLYTTDSGKRILYWISVDAIDYYIPTNDYRLTLLGKDYEIEVETQEGDEKGISKLSKKIFGVPTQEEVLEGQEVIKAHLSKAVGDNLTYNNLTKVQRAAIIAKKDSIAMPSEDKRWKSNQAEECLKSIQRKKALDLAALYPPPIM